MGDPASTRPSLLIRVRDPGDAEAWGEFVALYGPLIYQFARKQGLQDADAADLTQIVLQAVIDAMKRLDYDPQRGSFRSWLYKVVRNQLSKFRAQQRRSPRGSSTSSAPAVAPPLVSDTPSRYRRRRAPTEAMPRGKGHRTMRRSVLVDGAVLVVTAMGGSGDVRARQVDPP